MFIKLYARFPKKMDNVSCTSAHLIRPRNETHYNLKRKRDLEGMSSRHGLQKHNE